MDFVVAEGGGLDIFVDIGFRMLLEMFLHGIGVFTC